jgi:hypothetical protein
MQYVFIAVALLVLVTCSFGDKTPEGVRADQIDQQQQARIACRSKILMSAKYPDYVNTTHVQAARNESAGHWLVVARGTMKNGLGLDAPFEAYCHVNDQYQVTQFAIQ